MRLSITTGPSRGRSLEIGDETVTIGREPDCELLVDDLEVSRRHASLRGLPDGGVEVNDLGSRNGTFVDGKRIAAPVTLEGGERLTVGQTELAVEAGGAVAGASSAPTTVDAPPPPAPPGQPPPPASPGQPPPPRRSDSMIRRSHSAVQRAMLQRSVRRNTVIGVTGLVIGVVAVILALTGVLDSDGGGAAAQEEASPAEIVEAARPSTVLVVSRRGRTVFNGTGWVLDADEGLIVTNAHVVEPGASWEVGLSQDELQAAEIVGIASCEDLALMRIEDPQAMTLEGGGGLEAIALGDQSELQQGDTVVALGFPNNFARDFTLQATTGTVSVVEQEADIGPVSGDLELQTYPNVIQTDAAINGGNSGGPLIDTQLELVGVNTLRGIGSAESQGYAIGVDRVKEIIPILREGTSIAWAGINFVSTGSGLRINSVFPDSGAARTGLRPGDTITRVDGQPTGDRQQYCNAVGEVRSGDEVAVEGRDFFGRPFAESIAYE